MTALKEDDARERAVIASEKCVCLSIHKEEFKIIFDEERDKIKNKIELFKKKFTNWRGDEDFLITFSHFWNEELYKIGEVLLHEGQNPNQIFLVGDGEIIVSIFNDAHRKEGWVENKYV